MHGGHTQTSFPCHSSIIQIIKSAQLVFSKEPSLLELEGNFTVVGDIHGNIDDLLRIFEKRGYPPFTNYLFLGDYVDRGSHSPEVIILLFCLKILYPQNIFLIRGNHECETVTNIYGFRRDCTKRFSQRIYKKFMKCFMHLPFAAVINDSYICLHGGMSPHLESLEDLMDLDKPMISADSEIARDIVWSDPLESADGFTPSDRGTGYFFNNKKLDKFLKANNLKMMIRSHESCMDGYEKPLTNCLTIFSNTDYCGMNNNAAVAIIDQDEDSFRTEIFSPLTCDDLEMRRVIIPEWIFTEMTENSIPMKEPCVVSPQDLLDALSGPPLNLF
ncbi:Serine/threonine-protein phosphatase PP1 [Tritrichomonas foetus]|uniref:Serine/threonine-protein phosphatase n=1 Tax=Tritrichomonas foetus TaxID=1144522 RepID=A0A1J4JLA7_9EUKA|nr:Serine/threonine-protein phosphatase PP1 [Tritrichomonas foetus]|eukprot:OHS99457.1 Serine/threonine-protein phosphatase PP1 [Tritrichomonas foetus]